MTLEVRFFKARRQKHIQNENENFDRFDYIKISKNHISKYKLRFKIQT